MDLILHSPGGDPLAAESIVKLLRSKFDPIRVFIPNVAKSAATMIALSGDLIAMDERGELGPIDPQLVLISDQQAIISPAQALLDQFERARGEVQDDPTKLPGWLPLLRQYGPSLLVEAQNAIALSKDLVKQWLMLYMFRNEDAAEQSADRIVSFFGEHNNFLAHGRMVGVEDVIAQGVKAVDLRLKEHGQLRELVWDVYTTIGLTFDQTAAYKLIENDRGEAFIKIIQQVQVIGVQPPVVPAPQMPTGGSPGPLSPPGQPMNRQQRREAERGSRREG